MKQMIECPLCGKKLTSQAVSELKQHVKDEEPRCSFCGQVISEPVDFLNMDDPELEQKMQEMKPEIPQYVNKIAAIGATVIVGGVILMVVALIIKFIAWIVGL